MAFIGPQTSGRFAPSCFGAINAIHPSRPCYNYYMWPAMEKLTTRKFCDFACRILCWTQLSKKQSLGRVMASKMLHGSPAHDSSIFGETERWSCTVNFVSVRTFRSACTARCARSVAKVKGCVQFPICWRGLFQRGWWRAKCSHCESSPRTISWQANHSHWRHWGHRLQLSRNLRDSPGFIASVPGLTTVLLFVPDPGYA